jgi:hypothetical protein
MNDTLREFVVRRVRLRDDLKPVEIYMGDPPEPIQPDWVAITHGFSRRLDGYNLTFFRFDGTCITSEPFDTLEIALDEAHAIVGLEHSEWDSCHVEITDEDGRISWEEVTNAA